MCGDVGYVIERKEERLVNQWQGEDGATRETVRTIIHDVARPCEACMPARVRAAAARKSEAISRECGLSEAQRAQTFENFRRYKGNDACLRAAMGFAASPGTEWLVIAGEHGTGKTHLLAAVANAAIAAGTPVIYGYVPQLLDHLRQGYQQQPRPRRYWTGDGDEEPSEGGTFDERFERLCSVGLLLLDDLGTEAHSPWVVERLETLFDVRYRDRLATAITTNLDVQRVRRLSERILSRIERYPATIVQDTAVPLHQVRGGRS